MAEHLNQEVDKAPDLFNQMGKPIPQSVRQIAYDECKEMGLQSADAWSAVNGVCEQLERDKPYEAQRSGMRYLDLTGVYRLFAVILAQLAAV